VGRGRHHRTAPIQRRRIQLVTVFVIRVKLRIVRLVLDPVGVVVLIFVVTVEQAIAKRRRRRATA
jgi:hypothetical protein